MFANVGHTYKKKLVLKVELIFTDVKVFISYFATLYLKLNAMKKINK